MNKHPKKLLVIVTEAALETALASMVMDLGAHGYTVYDVRGAGAAGEREGAWEADRNIEMKVICAPDVADRIGEAVLKTYGEHYGLSMFFADVSVLRDNKY
ncbi:MAG: transcriptional regulator [Chitinophagaceae bacterium]|nr:transcriptional regulator [Rubrivivax sp.]